MNGDSRLQPKGESPQRIINVTIEDFDDGRTQVSSTDLPGLMLAGRNRTKILAAIEPAARAIIEHKGEDASRIMINATFIRAALEPEKPL